MRSRVFVATSSKKCVDAKGMPIYNVTGKKVAELNMDNNPIKHPEVKTPNWYKEFKEKIINAI